MKKINIIDGKFVEIPFQEDKEFIEVDDTQYEKIINGELIYKNGQLVKNTELETKHRIEELKQNLKDTDYKAIKYAEGQISEEEYVSVKEQRQEWRDEINQMEEEIKQN